MRLIPIHLQKELLLLFDRIDNPNSPPHSNAPLDKYDSTQLLPLQERKEFPRQKEHHLDAGGSHKS